jgi:hypothetical protein
VQRGAAQLQLFEIEIQKYTAAMKPKQGSQVRLRPELPGVESRRAHSIRG